MSGFLVFCLAVFCADHLWMKVGFWTTQASKDFAKLDSYVSSVEWNAGELTAKARVDAFTLFDGGEYLITGKKLLI